MRQKKGGPMDSRKKEDRTQCPVCGREGAEVKL